MGIELTTRSRKTLLDLQKKHAGKAQEFENRLHRTKSKSIKKILDVEPMVLYNLFKVDGTRLESVLNLIHTLEHGFYDDGEICLVRKERKFCHKALAEKVGTQYDYYIVDVHNYEQQCLTDEEVYDILESADKSYLYYNQNCDKIEQRVKIKGFMIGRTDEYRRWREVEKEHKQLLEKLYFEKHWEK